MVHTFSISVFKKYKFWELSMITLNDEHGIVYNTGFKNSQILGIYDYIKRRIL